VAIGCHSAIARWKARLPLNLALAGNPNVGKSSVFNWLTGMGVETANYAGKTVDVNLATTRFKDREIGIMDLPGTYGLGSTSEDQWVARQALLEARPEVVMVVVDATRLERNLYLPMQLSDLGFPVVMRSTSSTRPGAKAPGSTTCAWGASSACPSCPPSRCAARGSTGSSRPR
jgi:ferrous iron transport protein B